jgi:hypothetical protein
MNAAAAASAPQPTPPGHCRPGPHGSSPPPGLPWPAWPARPAVPRPGRIIRKHQRQLALSSASLGVCRAVARFRQVSLAEFARTVRPWYARIAVLPEALPARPWVRARSHHGELKQVRRCPGTGR